MQIYIHPTAQSAQHIQRITALTGGQVRLCGVNRLQLVPATTKRPSSTLGGDAA